MPILCERAARAGDLTPAIGGAVRAVDGLAFVPRMLDDDPAEAMVVIGPETGIEEALAFCAALRIDRPGVAVILIRDQVDIALLTWALRAGVREVVPSGDAAALAAACERARELCRHAAVRLPPTPAPPREGRIVTVFAAKGGCGKTTIAVNLGVALSEGTGMRVCVVDLDLAFGDVAIGVQLDPARTIVDALPMAGRLDTTGVASLLTPYRPGLDMLLAPTTPGDAERVPPALVAELLGVLRSMFDLVVVDTPAQLSEHVLMAMDASAHLVLLTTPDVAALKNLRVTLDMLDLLSYPKEIRSVLLNRSDSKVGLTADDVERVARCAIVAHVPSSRAVPISVNKGVPLTLSEPRHPVSQALFGFVQQHLLVAAAAPPGGLLSRMRGRRRPG